MGRKTFEQVLSFGQWPYGDIPLIVLSARDASAFDGVPDTVTFSTETPRALRDRLAGEGREHVYVDGGATVGSFLADGLVDQLVVTVIPVVLGAGISPFAALAHDVRLTQTDVRVFDFGFVQLTYAV